MELRDHEHVVECVAWAPESAAAAVNEAAGDNRRAAHQGQYLASGSRDKSVKVGPHTHNALLFSCVNPLTQLTSPYSAG